VKHKWQFREKLFDSWCLRMTSHLMHATVQASAGQLGRYDAARQAKPMPGRRLPCSERPRPSSSCADSTGRSCRRQRYDLQRPFPTGVTPHCHAVCSRVNVLSVRDRCRACDSDVERDNHLLADSNAPASGPAAARAPAGCQLRRAGGL
jgi:hypothetical protein